MATNDNSTVRTVEHGTVEVSVAKANLFRINQFNKFCQTYCRPQSGRTCGHESNHLIRREPLVAFPFLGHGGYVHLNGFGKTPWHMNQLLNTHGSMNKRSKSSAKLWFEQRTACRLTSEKVPARFEWQLWPQTITPQSVPLNTELLK